MDKGEDKMNGTNVDFYTILKKVSVVIGIIIGIGIVSFGVLVVYLSITDYKPEETIKIKAEGKPLYEKVNNEISMITWNIGYGGLGEKEDFFASGGKSVRPDKKETVENYMKGITDFLENNKADFYFIQEIDKESRRSYYIDEYKQIKDTLKNYQSVFAYNYKVKFVPAPFPPPFMGKVESGIALFGKYKMNENIRYQFPGNYKWPVYLAHLDRCFTVSRVDIEGKDHQLVLINTHNSAFDKDAVLRKQQMNYLKNVLTDEYEKGNYVIVGGDWNQLMPGISKEYFTNHLEGSDWVAPLPKNWIPKDWTWGFDKDLPTVRATDTAYIKGDTYLTSIDAFLMSPNVELLKIEVKDLDFKYSDHNPVYMEVKLR